MNRGTLENWAGSYRYGAARVHRPRTTDELRDIVSSAHKVKALGTRHSFNDIADTSGNLVSLEHFNDVDDPDPATRTVTVGAGVRYGQLCARLHAAGFALHNHASLPHISVAGACATATHGSGDRLGNLATAVRGVHVVTADGGVVEFSRDRDRERFNGVVVALGGVGVVTRLTLDVQPAFDVRQDVYEGLPLAQLEEHFDEITSMGDSVSLFTDWRGPRFNQVWLKRRVTGAPQAGATPERFGASRATRALHPIADISPVNCTEQLGVPGPWHERLPHFRMDYTPSSGEELQSEYFVPRAHAAAALRAVYGLREHVAPLLQISEVRTIAADELWMSPCYRRACVAIHFTWKKDAPAVMSVLPRVEAALEPFDARPHWGKLFTMRPGRLQSLYPKLPGFRQLLDAHDPHGRFRNAFLDRFVFGAA